MNYEQMQTLIQTNDIKQFQRQIIHYNRLGVLEQQRLRDFALAAQSVKLDTFLYIHDMTPYAKDTPQAWLKGLYFYLKQRYNLMGEYNQEKMLYLLDKSLPTYESKPALQWTHEWYDIILQQPATILGQVFERYKFNDNDSYHIMQASNLGRDKEQFRKIAESVFEQIKQGEKNTLGFYFLLTGIQAQEDNDFYQHMLKEIDAWDSMAIETLHVLFNQPSIHDMDNRIPVKTNGKRTSMSYQDYFLVQKAEFSHARLQQELSNKIISKNRVKI